MFRYLRSGAWLFFFVASAAGCTQQLRDSFRFQQREEVFDAAVVSVNTKLDMLWVIDASPSMAPAQKRIREGFEEFAARYMKPTWDIRVAVISQDTYLAHASFQNYLNSVGNGWYTRGSGYTSTYLNPSSAANPRRTTPFVNPPWWGGTLINASGTVQAAGVKLRQGVMEYGGLNLSQNVSPTNPSAWARLIPGRHDGPMATLCWTSNTNPFFNGITQCHVRDHQDLYSGVQGCVQGGTGDNDSAVQCVNTLMNNTVRSGKPIISTQPPEGVPADSAWTQKLLEDFLVNMSGGVSGLGIEKFFNSVSQLLTDNEAVSSNSKFFRPDALRAIVFVSDEDDQSMVFPSSQIDPNWGHDSGASCPWKTVDGHTYRLELCPQADKLLSVSAFKNQLDTFFRTLDGDPDGDPNYFVAAISPTNGQVVKTLHDEFGEDAGGYSSVSSDVATRIFALVDTVGNGSLKLDITEQDYSPLLDAIGTVVVRKKGVFPLSREPTDQEDMIVMIQHQDGSITVIPPTKYTIEGESVVITDDNIILGLSSTDHIVINYQPVI